MADQNPSQMDHLLLDEIVMQEHILPQPRLPLKQS